MSDVNRLQNHQIVTDIGALHDLKKTARENPKEALRAVAEQFEAIFVQQILKESRKVQLDGGWLEGGQSEFYQSWHDEQLSQSITSKGSLGLADIIVEQLSPKISAVSEEALEAHKQKLAEQQSHWLTKGDIKNDAKAPAPTTQDALLLRPFVQ